MAILHECGALGWQPTGFQDIIVGNKGRGWVRDGATLHECVPVGWQPTKSYRILRHHYWQQGARIGQGSGHFARMCACRLAILRHHCWQQGAGMGEGWGHFARMCTCRLAILRHHCWQQRAGMGQGWGQFARMCACRLATYRILRHHCWQQGVEMGQGWGHFARMCTCRLATYRIIFSPSLSLSFFLPSWLAQDSWPVSKAISPKWLPPMFRKLHTPKIIEHVELNLFASAEISLSQRV